MPWSVPCIHPHCLLSWFAFLLEWMGKASSFCLGAGVCGKRSVFCSLSRSWFLYLRAIQLYLTYPTSLPCQLFFVVFLRPFCRERNKCCVLREAFSHTFAASVRQHEDTGIINPTPNVVLFTVYVFFVPTPALPSLRYTSMLLGR